jgi:SnoaL-like domain
VQLRARATGLLEAFARSDLEAIGRLCSDDVLLWGTDDGEAWQGKQQVLSSFAGAYDLEVRWLREPTVGEGWVAGLIEFVLADGERLPSRVTMVFREGLLVHAHYSVALGVEDAAQ